MKKESDNFKYNLDFLEFVFSYISDYGILEIDIDSIHNFSNKEKHVLAILKQIYHKLKLLKDYQTVQLEHFSNEEVLTKANSFLIDLFPKRKQEILDLDNLINFGNYTSYDAGLKYRLSKKKIEFDEILIPTNGSNYTSSIIVHEKVHALAFNNVDLVSLFVNNLELFPMLLQRISLDYIDDSFCSILDRVVRINDTKENFNHLDFMHYLKNSKNKTKIDEYVCDYLYLRGYDYLISELYSDLLFKYYLLDKDKMKKKINQVFDHKLSVSDFLDSYNVNLLNKDLIPTIKEETDKCKRISIMP